MRTLLAAACVSLLLAPFAIATAAEHRPPTRTFDIEQTVVSMELEEGVTGDDAVDALRSKAVQYNMKFVAHQPLSKELEARGIDTGRLEIFQFCNPSDAHEMVSYNPIFAAYMPCRIALVEDPDTGKLMLMMMDLDMLINNTELPPELQEMAVNISSTLKKMMRAAAAGEF